MPPENGASNSGSDSGSEDDSKSESSGSGSGSGSDSDSGSSSSSSRSRSKSKSRSRSKSKSQSRSRSRSGSRSKSRYSSDRENGSYNPNSPKTNESSKENTYYDNSESQSSPEKATKSSRSTNFKSDSDMWEENPDIYGIRRSNRSRKEPERLKIIDSDSNSDKVAKKSPRTWRSGSSDSDSDRRSPPPASKRPGQRRPAPKKKAVRRRNRYSSDDESTDGSEDDTRRAGSRRAAAVSYKEDSENEKTDSSDLLEVDPNEAEVDEEEDKSETIEKILAQRRGKKGVTGNVTTCYSIEENGDPNDGVDLSDLDNTEPQYLIKWKDWSHIHNTWESEQSLKDQKVKGIKKLENYIKKETDIAWWKRHATPEDIDYFECQFDLQQDLLKSYYEVERIIAEHVREDGSGTDYFCKWQSLPYADATWEDAPLIERKWPTKIDEFRCREDSRTTPSRLSKVLRYRPKFHQLREQPDYMGGEQALQLRDYQMDGLNWMIHAWCKENSVILADEMGLGKTIQTICFLNYLFRAQFLHGPFLCVVPLSTMTAWEREFQLWAPEINVVTYLGDVVSRDIIRKYEWSFESNKRLKFNAILTTYEIVLKDRLFLGGFSWAALLVDEAHRLKNDDSLLYKALKEFDTNHRLLITGTPLQNSLKELWALLYFIMPGKFSTWEEFEKDHEHSALKGYDKLHRQLEPFILRRQKKDVEKSLPAKVEQILRVEMSSIQRQYYKWILTKNYDALRKGNKGSSTTFLNIVVELKKCCNHSLLIKRSEEEVRMSNMDALQQLIRGSGKLVLLDKLLCRLKETGHRVLIFSQMVRMLDILAEYLQKRHFSFQRLDGSIKGELRRQALDHFNAPGSLDFCFLLSTRAGGLGINLATADTVIIFDSDWNPQNDLQAQARAHRIGQKNQVNIYRLVTARSVEEEIVERAKRKMVLDHLVIQRMDTTGRTVLDKKGAGSTANTTPFNKEDLNAILKFGAEELFKDDEDGDEEPVCDIDEILRRAETRDEAPTMVGDELLSAFKVASFAFDEEKTAELPAEAEEDSKDWEEIIPENFRNAVKKEEKSKEMEDLYLPPRSRKTLQQKNEAEKAEGGKGKKNKKRSDDDEDEDIEEGEASDHSDDDKPRKRGRPPVNKRENIKGFTDNEIRRFIKSYKKFSAPLKRLEDVACDAELQEKPLSDLTRLGEMLRDRCQAQLASISSGKPEAVTAGKRKARITFTMGGVNVNAKTLSQCENELAPLDDALPSDADSRLKWQLDFSTRGANFDVDWGAHEDSRLLCGIYQYGMGAWEAIKMDDTLGLGNKIITNDGRKPQVKHLQSRAEYLLKILKKLQDKNGGSKSKKSKKVDSKNDAKSRKKLPRKTKQLSKEVTDNNDPVSEEDKKASKVKLEKMNDESNHGSEDNDKKDKRKTKRDKKEPKGKNSKKKPVGPMHFTANNEPRSLEVLGDLDPSVFEECKEKMRPVKKALRALDNPDQSLSEEEQMVRTRTCLRQIGNQIDHNLETYWEPDKRSEWRTNLWYFVSKFTNFDAKQLYKLYKYTLKKGDSENHDSSHSKEEKSQKSSKHSSNHNNHTKGGGNANHKNDKSDKDKAKGRDKKELKKEKITISSSLSSLNFKRKLEDGECDPDSVEGKKLKENEDSKKKNFEASRDRDRSDGRDRERDHRDRDRDRDRDRERRDSGGTRGASRGFSDHSNWQSRFSDKRTPSDPRGYEGAHRYRPDRGPHIHDKRRFHPFAQNYGGTGGYYPPASDGQGSHYPPHRSYPPDWREYPPDYNHSAEYPSDYVDREYTERERDYRRDYDRRPPPS